MTAQTPSTELLRLFRAIASRDRAAALRLLTESPGLALEPLVVGATRETPNPYFFDELCHYVYAGDTALHVAAAAYQTAIAAELVAKGASPSARNRRGAEPLHYAADGLPGSPGWDPAAQYAIVESLIRAGASANAQDKSGVAPLHRAVRTRSSAAVRALLEHGADPVGKNQSGSTPLHLAVQNTGRGSSGSREAREQQSEIILLLLAHGAGASDRDASGRSVSECARAEWIQALLRAR